MEYISVEEAAQKWGLSIRSVRIFANIFRYLVSSENENHMRKILKGVYDSVAVLTYLDFHKRKKAGYGQRRMQ
jgi:macrodomain Ter protein organizer (MatP/YcbG family)